MKDTKMSDFMKIRPVRVELFHADGRTDGQTVVMNLVVFFANLRMRLKSNKEI